MTPLEQCGTARTGRLCLSVFMSLFLDDSCMEHSPPSSLYDPSLGNSLDKLRHTRYVAYLVELVLLNEHQITGGGAYLDYYPSLLRGQFRRRL